MFSLLLLGIFPLLAILIAAKRSLDIKEWTLTRRLCCESHGAIYNTCIVTPDDDAVAQKHDILQVRTERLTWTFSRLCDESPNERRSSEESSPKRLFPPNQRWYNGGNA